MIQHLSNRLTGRYGKGFSVPNLRNFRKFYLMFQDRKPEIRYPLGNELPAGRKRYPSGSELSVTGKGQTKDGRSLMGFHPNPRWWKTHPSAYRPDGRLCPLSVVYGFAVVCPLSSVIWVSLLFASKHMLYLPTEEELQRELGRERKLIEERQHIGDGREQDF